MCSSPSTAEGSSGRLTPPIAPTRPRGLSCSYEGLMCALGHSPRPTCRLLLHRTELGCDGRRRSAFQTNTKRKSLNVYGRHACRRESMQSRSNPCQATSPLIHQPQPREEKNAPNKVASSSGASSAVWCPDSLMWAAHVVGQSRQASGRHRDPRGRPPATTTPTAANANGCRLPGRPPRDVDQE
jgi:hypothetical protein